VATKDGKKSGGRKPGTPNKEAPSLEARARALGVDFWDMLAEIAADKEHPRHFDAVKEGCSYLYAKRKALEINTDFDPELIEMAKTISQLPKDELLRIIAEEMKKAK
jgi:hypothetical protein